MKQSFFLIMILIACFTSGCSSYRVYDSFDMADGKDKPSYESEEIEVWIRFKEDNLFGSIGLLGLPIIPVYVKIVDNKTVTVESILTLRKEQDFFINISPCLMLDATNKICATELVVDAVALYQDDGTMSPDGKKRWNKLPEFDWRNKLIITSGRDKANHLGRKEIYEHFGYKTRPSWDFLKITFTHNFLCIEKCPNRFTLDANGFLTVNSLSIINTEYPYQKQRHHAYDFIVTNLQ